MEIQAGWLLPVITRDSEWDIIHAGEGGNKCFFDSFTDQKASFGIYW